MNKVMLVGRLTDAPMQNDTQTKTTFTIAINDYARKEKVSYFFPVSVFGEVGNTCVKFLNKGSQVAITGKLTQYRYQDEDGNTKTTLQIIGEQVDFLGSKPTEKIKEINDEDIPF